MAGAAPRVEDVSVQVLYRSVCRRIRITLVVVTDQKISQNSLLITLHVFVLYIFCIAVILF